MEAHVLSLNDFHMPKVYSEHDANYVHIIYLLLLEKGKFQSHPDMGVDIRSYRYNNDENVLQELQSSIAQQIETYLPEVQFVEDVTVGFLGQEKTLGILISTNDGTYAFDYNPVSNEMVINEQYIVDQLGGD